MTQKKYLKTDAENRVLSTREELEEYLKFREENDIWLIRFINQVSYYGIDSSDELFMPQKAQNIIIKRNTYSLPVEDIDLDDYDTRDCIDNLGAFLVTTDKGSKNYAYPMSELGYLSALQRLDDFCGTMARFDNRKNKLVLPIEEKCQRMTRDSDLYGDTMKILYRDGKIRVCNSNVFVILPAEKLVEALEKELKQQHPDMTFVKGQVSHEYLICEYLLKDKGIEESLRLKLNDFGQNIKTLESGVQFVTSDVGLSAVTANLYFVIDGVQVNLGGVYMLHKGESSIEMFEEKLLDFGQIMTESEELIEKLGNTVIKNPQLLVKKLCEKYNNVFPTKKVEEFLPSIPATEGTGIDILLALSGMIDNHLKSKEINAARYLELQEQVFKIVKLPLSKIESGEMEL